MDGLFSDISLCTLLFQFNAIVSCANDFSDFIYDIFQKYTENLNTVFFET